MQPLPWEIESRFLGMQISIIWVVFAVKTVTLLWQPAKAQDIARACHSSRVSDQLSDRLIFGRLFQANEKFSTFRSCANFVDLLTYYLQSKDELAAVLLRDTTG